MPFRRQARRIFLAPALGLLLAAALAACSSGSSSSSSSAVTSSPPASVSASASPTASSSSASATAEIKANWAEFFNSATPNSKRVELLENGSEFTDAIKAFSASPLASSVTSTVNSVKFSSATKATVTYDLTAGGQPVAQGQQGTAVMQNGVWKVGDDVFCGLLKQGASLMGLKVPAACK